MGGLAVACMKRYLSREVSRTFQGRSKGEEVELLPVNPVLQSRTERDALAEDASLSCQCPDKTTGDYWDAAG